MTTVEATISRSSSAAFASGVSIGVLGGMIGLGGAEFRLPVLIPLMVVLLLLFAVKVWEYSAS